MTTAAKPTPAEATDLVLPGLIHLPPPEGQPYTDEQLIQMDEENPGWRFEVGCEGELVINMGSGGVTSDIEIEMGAQLRDWRRSGGGGRTRSSSAGYWLGGAPRRPPEMEPDLSWLSDEQFDAVCLRLIVEGVTGRSVPSSSPRFGHPEIRSQTSNEKLSSGCATVSNSPGSSTQKQRPSGSTDPTRSQKCWSGPRRSQGSRC